MLPFNKVQSFIASGNLGLPLGVILVAFYGLSIVMFLSSFVFTLLIYNVERFESPAESRQLIERALLTKDEHDFLSTIIAGYSIATSRNHKINDKKEAYLSKALFSFFIAVIFVVISLFLSKSIGAISGGM